MADFLFLYGMAMA